VSAAATLPGPVRHGDRVALVAPSSAISEEQLAEALDLLARWDLEPVLGAHVRDTHPRAGSYLAGTDADRAADLMRAWTDDSVTAVLCLCGGYGAVRILDHLDVARLRAARPKLFVGSSDITGLHEFWERELAVPTLFAPMLGTNDLMSDPGNLIALHRALFTATEERTLLAPGAEAIVEGEAEGTLTGGNLSLLAMTTGSHASAPRAAGKIVLLEDVEEKTYRVDGFLVSLLRSGYFDGAVGIALGTWHECGPLPEIRALVEELLAPLGIPLIWGLPFGHGPGVASVPLGVRARIIADAGQPRIELRR
jgi:muramoyltetrapeptide carboxypeptidase